MAPRYDAVVGGSHNGLTCGAYLREVRATKTLVLERRPCKAGRRHRKR